MPTENDEPLRRVRLQDLLHEERDRRGWSTYDAGDWFGVNQSTYSRWEQGKGLNDDKLLKVAEYLRRDLTDVVLLHHRKNYGEGEVQSVATHMLELRLDELSERLDGIERLDAQILGFLRGLGSRFGVEFIPELRPPPLPPPGPEQEPPANGESTSPGSS